MWVRLSRQQPELVSVSEWAQASLLSLLSLSDSASDSAQASALFQWWMRKKIMAQASAWETTARVWIPGSAMVLLLLLFRR